MAAILMTKEAFESIMGGAGKMRSPAPAATDRGALRIRSRVRAKLGLSQPTFAALLRVSVATVRNGEPAGGGPRGPRECR
jgi:DNA-binding transcriptional regulator YiaG